MQFLTLVEDSEESEHTEEIDRLYACLDTDDGTTSSSEEEESKSKKKKSKKSKAKNNSKVWHMCFIFFRISYVVFGCF